MEQHNHEQWRIVYGRRDYEVSDRGQVRRARDYKLLKGCLDQGYRRIHFSDAHVRVHVLVWEAFHGERPQGLVVRHLNDVKTDNRLGNLAIGTVSDNTQDALRNGRQGWAKRTHCSQGHQFTPENTFDRGNGHGRACRTCKRINGLRTWHSRKTRGDAMGDTGEREKRRWIEVIPEEQPHTAPQPVAPETQPQPA